MFYAFFIYYWKATMKRANKNLHPTWASRPQLWHKHDRHCHLPHYRDTHSWDTVSPVEEEPLLSTVPPFGNRGYDSQQDLFLHSRVGLKTAEQHGQTAPHTYTHNIILSHHLSEWDRCCSAYMTRHVRCVYMIWISLSMQSCSLSCQLRSSATHKAMRDSLSSLARNGHSTCTVLTLCSERGKNLTHTKSHRISRNVTTTLLARLTFLLKISISTK